MSDGVYGTVHMTATPKSAELRRRNIRTALLLGAFAAFIFVTSFPFWQGLFRLVGNQPG